MILVVSLERRRVKIRFTWTESLFTNLHLHFTETKQFDCLKSDFPFSINNSVCSEKDEFLAKKWFKLVIKSFILLCFYILFEKQTTFFLSSIFWAASEVYCVFLCIIFCLSRSMNFIWKCGNLIINIFIYL